MMEKGIREKVLNTAILLQINVQHPAAKSMIEVARTQDEEVGDGTTSVIILGEFSF